MKKAYVTLCNSERYLLGALAMYESLNATQTEYPLIVFVSKNAPDSFRIKLKKYANKTENNNCKLLVLETDEEVVIESEKSEGNTYQYWNGTFDKLLVFGLTKYDKLVFIDSDMLVFENLDELFEKDHLTACAAGRLYPGNESWTALNSGLLVIEPNKKEKENFIGHIPEAILDLKSYGDQDVINYMNKDWKEKSNLHLSEQYNLFFALASYYKRAYGFDISKGAEKSIKVVHFVGARKPWNPEIKVKLYYKFLCIKNYLKNRNRLSGQILKEFNKYLKIAKKKLED